MELSLLTQLEHRELTPRIHGVFKEMASSWWMETLSGSHQMQLSMKVGKSALCDRMLTSHVILQSTSFNMDRLTSRFLSLMPAMQVMSVITTQSTLQMDKPVTERRLSPTVKMNALTEKAMVKDAKASSTKSI